MPKTILITGTTSGIGLSLKKDLLKNNNLICVNRPGGVTQDIEANKSVYDYNLDITNYNEVENFVEELVKKNIPDIFILNAGINQYDNSNYFDVKNFKKVIDTNLFGVLNFVSILEKKKIFNKKIIFISSTSNIVPNPAGLGYYSSKLLLYKLAKQLNKNNTNLYKTAILGPIFTNISRDIDVPSGIGGKIYSLLVVKTENMLPKFKKFLFNEKKFFYFTKISILFYLIIKIVLFFFPKLYQGGKN